MLLISFFDMGLVGAKSFGAPMELNLKLITSEFNSHFGIGNDPSIVVLVNIRD